MARVLSGSIAPAFSTKDFRIRALAWILLGFTTAGYAAQSAEPPSAVLGAEKGLRVLPSFMDVVDDATRAPVRGIAVSTGNLRELGVAPSKTATLAYRIYPDGHEELVRNAAVAELSSANFKSISAVSDQRIESPKPTVIDSPLTEKP